MALVLGKFDGGTTRSKLGAVLGTAAKQFRQFTLFAAPSNTGTVRFGGANVTDVANEKLALAAGLSVNLGPQGCERPFVVDTESIYVVGSAAGQVCYIVANTDDGR